MAQALPERDPRSSSPTRSTRCARWRYKVSGFPKQRVVRDGGRPRLGAHARVHRDGAGRLGREHERLRARRPRRHDGPAAALLDRLPASRSPSCCRPTRVEAIVKRTASGGAEIVVPAEDGLGLLRAVLLHRGDGRRRAQGQAQDPALLLLPRGRVRDHGASTSASRPSSAQKGVEKIWEIKLTDAESRRPQEVRGRGQGARRHPEAVLHRSPPVPGLAATPARAPPPRRATRAGRSRTDSAGPDRRGPALGASEGRVPRIPATTARTTARRSPRRRRRRTRATTRPPSVSRGLQEDERVERGEHDPQLACRRPGPTRS